ncbi:TetR/AcrR family transcriptional regulator [Parasphingorhabdus sp. JC815]|uniref:TetR/AcrR family transcriptional regulator n=1 Tax=Parasphingorhabdus sp. JC815 TaxID=3232140 RepID=UPI0034577097
MKKRVKQHVRRQKSDAALKSAAAKIISREGYNAVTFERIGEVSGYSRTLASQKYGSKDGLILELLKSIVQASSEKFEARMTLTADPLAKIQGYTDEMLQTVGEDFLSAYFVIMADAVANRQPAQQFFKDRHLAVRDKLAELITRGQEEGVIDNDLDPDSAALLIGSFQLGIAVHYLLAPDTDMSSFAITARKLFLKALSSP